MNDFRHRVLASAFLAALVAAAPGVAEDFKLKSPLKVSSMTKDQFAKVGDNDPIEFNGKVTTKAALLAPLRNARVESEAALKIKLAEASRKLEEIKARSASLQRQQVSQSKGLVTAELAKLKKLFPPLPKATPTPCAGPVVAGVIGLVTPDSDVLVLGHCFGTQQGTAQLQGGFGSVNLPIIEWHDGGIGLHIPATLTGGPDQIGYDGAQIIVQTAQGQNPAVPPRVDFHAARETRILEAREVSIVCSNGADINNCDPNPGRALDASHSNTVDFTSDKGVDEINTNLKNGWIVTDQQVSSHYIGNPAFTPDLSWDAVPAPNTSVVKMHYRWSVSPFQYFRFIVVLYAEGPVGTNPR